MKAFFSRDIRPFILAALLLLGPSAFSAEGGRLYQGDSGSPLARSNKIDPNLRVMAQELVRRGITRANARAQGAADLSTALVRISEGGALQAYIHSPVLDGILISQLENLGARVEIADTEAGIVQAWIPYDALDAVASLAAVRKITVPSFGRARLASCVTIPGQTCTTEGDAIHGADALRALGYDGSGIKVGVISDGADSLCDAVNEGELPAGISVFGTCNDANPCGCTNGDEGVAMMEIVHDMAPGATLAFGAGLASTLAFRSRIDELMNTFHADVIVDDLGFYLEPYFEDGPIAQKVQEAVNAGILYTSSAGNDAQDHYESDYVDSGDGKGSHRIAPGNTVFNVTGSQVVVVVQWSNPFGASADNYDLCLQGETNAQCAPFNTVQNGNDDPIEFSLFNCPGGAGCGIQVRKISGAGQRIELFVLGGTLSAADRVSAGSIFGHPTIPGVFAAAAVDAADPGHDTVESYSSVGPSRLFFPSAQTRDKPNLAASDGVEVGGFGGFPSPFFGTSAAAPHIAAAAAQLLGGLGSPPEVHGALTDGAVDIGAAGFDFLSGAGRLDIFNSALLLNDPPESVIDTPGGVTIHQGESLIFTGSCSDPDGTQGMGFLWTFQAPSGISDKTVEDPGSLTFNTVGSFGVSFTCRDNFGVADASPASITITVLSPDGDGDSVADVTDNCPAIANANQANQDGDALGDTCDNCPAVSNPDQGDGDQDGIGNACDPTPCGAVCDDGNACNGVETCNPSSGQCVPGTPVVCGDNNACNGVETCNPSNGQCVSGTPVVCDDGNACNGLETCDGLTGGCLPGTPVACGDGNVCNGVETCNPANGQCLPGTPLSCDDGNACNGIESCNSLSGCQAGTLVVCGDGNACNGVETCNPLNGQCVPGTAVVCGDGNVCNGTETCNPSTGNCDAGISLSCNDGNLCNGTETCDPTLGCQSGTSLNCQDSNICNGVETCSPTLGCQSGAPLNCADSDPCTLDSCNSVSGCAHDPVPDSDGDGLCDVVDPCPEDPNDDSDSDTVCGDIDNCPDVQNLDQGDLDQDGAGDACDEDDDGDGVADSEDNCPVEANADQVDRDLDHIGDVCDPTDDSPTPPPPTDKGGPSGGTGGPGGGGNPPPAGSGGCSLRPDGA